ncbi:MAG: GNAT family N-acetyltransferase [Oscillospiraceae bacterium]
MDIQYKETKDFSKAELQDLFLAVEWASGKHPEILEQAMINYNTVFSAWDGNKLVGLISALDDTVMTAYIQYVLVRPDYQGFGIGRELVKMTKEKYKEFLRVILIAVNGEINFYRNCGFEVETDTTPMSISILED